MVAPETVVAYDRVALFGDWIDADRDGCNTRSEVLQRQSLTAVTYSTGCTVSTGRWYSYLDEAYWTVASDVDIDHLIPLKEAWDSGVYAQGWSASRRLAFANDLGYDYSLEAITDNVNQSKSDRDIAEWLPPAASAHCSYAIRWVAVKYRWNLTVDSNEHARLSSLLTGSCGDYQIGSPPKG